ncbi:11134_t:CDS:2, partial [Dentiscutata erythropus]
LANSEALKAGRKVDPLGLRTLGIITKMDLMEPEVGAAILRNSDYPLHLGYTGSIFYVYSQRGIQVGIDTLRKKLMEVLEEGMAKSLFSIV